MAQPDHRAAACSPVQNEDAERVEPGIALCLSGGGYRAMLFHVGALWRLNELGYLPKLDRVSSVSGGSITAGVAGDELAQTSCSTPTASRPTSTSSSSSPFASSPSKTIDLGAVIRGILLPGTIADRVAGAYRKHVFGEPPSRTCRQTAVRHQLDQHPDRRRSGDSRSRTWRTTRSAWCEPQGGARRRGRRVVGLPADPLAGSLKLDAASFDGRAAGRLQSAVHERGRARRRRRLRQPRARDRLEALQHDPRQRRRREDGGQPKPKHDWARHAYRVLGVIDTQVRNLRKRQVVSGYLRGDRQGTYWGIRSHIGDYGPPAGSLPCPDDKALRARPDRDPAESDGRHAARAAHQLGLRDL